MIKNNRFIQTIILAATTIVATGAIATNEKFNLTVADTQQGAVKGANKGDYVEFLGIPYAEPPVGDLRFAPPVEPKKRSGEFFANKFSSQCVQLNEEQVVGSEDCLYLNIYRPTASDSKDLPVMLYIHGGGLLTGSAEQADGKELASKNNVVLVAMNYRLNGFGFFFYSAISAASPSAPTNFGILDQRMAMKWVRQNIKNFGGNPNNVTIFGYSSGGISVLAHMASQASKSMFDKAIALSGAWYPKGRTLKQAEESGVIDSQKWGCAGNEINTLECLRSQPINRIVQASPPPGEYEFVPLVDGKLLNQAPDAAFRKGEFSKVPFITSATSDEYGLYLFDLGEQTKDTFAQTIADYLSPYADRKIPPADIVKEYKLDQYKSPTKVLSSAVTDFMIACQQLKTAENMVKYNPDIWAFQFSAKSNPKPNFDVPVWFGDIGNFHGVDHPYYFGNFDQPVSKDINELAITLRSYLSNFARTSNPNGNGAAVWKRLSESPDTVLNASTPIDPNWNAKKQHHCSFWADYELQL